MEIITLFAAVNANASPMKLDCDREFNIISSKFQTRVEFS